jgi:hypothetical protein
VAPGDNDDAAAGGTDARQLPHELPGRIQGGARVGARGGGGRAGAFKWGRPADRRKKLVPE